MSNSYIYLNIYILQGTFKNVIYIYIYTNTYVYMSVCIITLKHALQVIAIKALWQLVHLGTLIYGYMLLAFRIQTQLKLTVAEQE